MASAADGGRPVPRRFHDRQSCQTRASILLAMLRVVIHLRDERGKESVFATEPMDPAAAEAERTRIEEEHSQAGDKNRWIRIGGTSVQSKDIAVIRIEEPYTAADFGETDEPFFRRDMKF